MLKKLALAGLLLPLASVAYAANNPPKVDICHISPDNPGHVVVISVSQNAVANHLSHGDTLSFEGYCYTVEPASTTLADDEQFCIDQYGGHLASIHSAAEDNFVSQLVDPAAAGGITARIGGIALGGFCSGPGATYAWTDGTPWNYQNWRLTTGEPNCSGAPASVQLWPNTNGSLSGWNDTPASDALGEFVCKFQP